MTKKKSTAGTVALLIVAAATFLILMFIFRGSLFGGKEPVPSAVPDTAEKDDQKNTDSAAETSRRVRVALEGYEVYRLDDLDFVFVIADLHLSMPEADMISLSDFVTDEGIILSETGEYEKALEEHGYYPGRRNVMFSFVSMTGELDASVLIPVRSADRSTLTVRCAAQGVQDLEFDLTGNVLTDGSGLYYSRDEVISDESTYRIIVRQALDITDEMFFMTDSDGSRMQYYIPSADRVYALQIEALSLAETGIVINAAEFIPDGYDSGFQAMDAGIRSMKETNIIGRTINEEDSGFLFFDVFGPAYTPVSYSGTLRLYLDSGAVLNVNVNLN